MNNAPHGAAHRFLRRDALSASDRRPSPAAPGLAALVRCLAAIALAVVLAPPLRAQAPPQLPPKELVIASEGARPPYNYLDSNNELAGFEIDLGRLLCARMKLQCRFVTQDWDGLTPGLLNRQYDAIMAAMEITDEAKEKIAFSKPYIRMPSAFIASMQSDIKDTTPAGLKGRSIGVESGGAHQNYLDDLYKQSEIRPYATLEEAILDLAEGRLDLVIGDKDAISDFLKSRKEGQCCKIVADAPHEAAYFGNGVGVGLRKEDVALKAMFDKAIDETMADGSFAKLQSKYFDYKIN
ncbi:extracellular solute-binding protein family 3 [Methylocella silvestris BL2]|uniref:Extracellular solute-binding protein family 3 n=1 Tax=Methylocella silvestris (strain DSM 15510 / CIP 108128 / LMG 27833 / NCIMB 13906 / BL2) TaxID=395965 RepID=B8ELP2_METSB|nr:transporter substrate-binding domain-containing protein [Methylocella silvestris]ACK50036.1 extracellular solute-binding protein family 3 [Methylocella silvestris BL2]